VRRSRNHRIPTPIRLNDRSGAKYAFGSAPALAATMMHATTTSPATPYDQTRRLVMLLTMTTTRTGVKTAHLPRTDARGSFLNAGPGHYCLTVIRFGSIIALVALMAIGCGSMSSDGGTHAYATTSSSSPAPYSVLNVRRILREHGFTVYGAPRAPFYEADLNKGPVVNSKFGAVYFVMFRSAAAAHEYLATASGARALRGWIGESARRVVKRNVVFFEPTSRAPRVRGRVQTAVAAFTR
jgi:hypothetical protein